MHRFWNLANALDSFIVHGAGSETVNPALISYRWACMPFFFSQIERLNVFR